VEFERVKSPRWEAITKIVESFVAKGHPGYAIAALAMILLAGLVGLGLLSKLGEPIVSLLL
jgi:hypothetical protein